MSFIVEILQQAGLVQAHVNLALLHCAVTAVGGEQQQPAGKHGQRRVLGGAEFMVSQELLDRLSGERCRRGPGGCGGLGKAPVGYVPCSRNDSGSAARTCSASRWNVVGQMP